MHEDNSSQYEGSSSHVDLTTQHLREITAQVITAITSPQFVEAVRVVGEVPVERRLLEGSRRLTPDALKEQGVELPEGFRISSRYFDESLPRPVEFGDQPGRCFNPVNTLNAREPGMLDRLRASDPVLYRRLTELADNESSPAVGARAGGCACGGVRGTCGGVGVFT